MISEQAIDFVKKMKLGFVATVRPDGKPNLSHKGTLTVFDDRHLIFADIASPQTSENLKHNPEVAVEVVNPFSRRGYRFRGKAQVVPIDKDATHYVAFYENWGLTGVQARVKNFVLIEVYYSEQVFSPAYAWGSTEPELVSRWKPYYENLWKF